MDNNSPLEFGKYYHIYNRGINGCNLFFENKNYNHFLNLMEKHLTPVADVLVWCLMKNHFHLLVEIKENFKPDRFQKPIPKPDRFKKPVRFDKPTNPSQCFSNLFNAYTKAINKRYDRTGALFERPFHRKSVENEEYLMELVRYIHNNPVNHGFADSAIDYPWSSYGTVISLKPTKLKREIILEWFGGRENFKEVHENEKYLYLDEIEVN